MKIRKILLIGGYGLAGSNITRLLLEKTSISIVIGGRNMDKANKTVTYFNNLFSGNRVQSLFVDVSDIDSIKNAVMQCDLVIDCIPLNTGYNAEIAQEAVNANIDYINLNIEKNERKKLNELFDASINPDLHLLTHCGIFPGLPSVLTRLAASRFDKLNEVMIGMIGSSTGGGSVNALEEMISADIKTPYAYKNNAWQKASMSASRKINFGSPFGIRKCYLCNLDEVKKQPQKFNIKEFKLYAAETNIFMMIIIVIWNFLKLNKFQSGIKLGAKLLNWGVKKFAKQPFGITLKMEAMGEIKGISKQLDIYLFCNDVYKSTAISTVACILQLIDDTIKTYGVSYMGHAVDIDRFLTDMEKLGMSVDILWR